VASAGEPSSARSRNMAAIQGKNTKPELRVRKYLHSAGLRYRLHVRGMCGKPDLVLPRWRAVIFVHGCFWHRHEGCRFATIPRTRTEFWTAKFEANMNRDVLNGHALAQEGWRVFVIWECETKDADRLASLVAQVTATGPDRR
jgi:DNA mismatch endonuclease, patch repair protein